ncbi:MAG: hypothetical protein RLZZ370_2026 [Bacteroidota bacterium]|jgi:hypothetical protein
MLLCTTMVMGLLPLSMHLCCEERCCDVPEVQASCCSMPAPEKPVAPEDDCCQNQSFFNLAPVFAPIKIGFEQHLQEAGMQEPMHSLSLPEAVAYVPSFELPGAHPPERLKRHLAIRVLII